MEPRGLYRERNGWNDQDCVRVKYDEHQELDVPEDAIEHEATNHLLKSCLGKTRLARQQTIRNP
jgi:hypothetical protein